MKVVPKALVAAVVIVLICVLFVVWLVVRYPMRNRPEPGTSAPEQAAIENRKSKIENSDWPMFRGGQNLSGVASGTLPDSLVPIWKFKTGDSVKSSPVIVNDRVFVGSSDNNIYAIDLANGKQVWAYKTTDAVEATPCVVEGSVLVGSSDGFLYALDARSGSLRWKHETDGQILGAANWTRR